MADRFPTRTEFLDLKQAQDQSTQDLSERLVKIEKLVDEQQSRNNRQEDRNQGILYAVIVAFLLVVLGVAAEVLLTTKHDDSIYGEIYSQVISVEEKLSGLQNQFDLLKAKNSYLK
jgi:tetrahydromethanopterin S-methyltransferase subunit G